MNWLHNIFHKHDNNEEIELKSLDKAEGFQAQQTENSDATFKNLSNTGGKNITGKNKSLESHTAANSKEDNEIAKSAEKQNTIELHTLNYLKQEIILLGKAILRLILTLISAFPPIFITMNLAADVGFLDFFGPSFVKIFKSA